MGEADALELAGGALGEFVAEDHPARDLERRQRAPDVVAEFGLGGSGVVGQHHCRGDLLAEFVVRHGERHGLGNGFVA